MSQVIKLKWKQTTFSQMNDLDDTNFYMFVRLGKIIYIGMTAVTSEQSVQDEINSKKDPMFNGNVAGVSVWLGYLKKDARYNNSIKRLSDNIVHDVENLLIYTVKPANNTQCVNNYGGRDLLIVNEDCPLLPDKIDSTELAQLESQGKSLKEYLKKQLKQD
ncbi:MAG: hypothetical protein IKJ56_09600 [Bacteroidales bacterium]|nr:hypothetical protein [Bacteroidales bacterium]